MIATLRERPWALAAVLLAEAGLLVGMLVDPRLPAALVFAVLAVLVVLSRPIWGVGVLIASRIISTNALTIVRAGSFGLGLFEVVALLCLIALAWQAMRKKVEIFQDWPWRIPLLAFLGFGLISLSWSVKPGEGMGDLVPILPILLNTTLVLAFTKSWQDFRTLAWFWLGATVTVCLMTVAAGALGIEVGSVSFQAAAGGNRETGLGQQPNWFAMTLFFCVPLSGAMAMAEPTRKLRLLALALGIFVAGIMLSSGSRGGAFATLIGAGLMSLANPRIRRIVVRVAFPLALLLGIAVLLDIGGLQRPLERIGGGGLVIQQDYRPWNWSACWGMFRDTWGRGIGAGGYSTLLPDYNYRVSTTQYDYPHGVFWQILAHFGVVGLGLFGWMVQRVFTTARAAFQQAKGTAAEPYVWAMPTAMVGYAAWTFVEFEYAEKPFWEFLALFTALALLLQRGVSVPSWSLGDSTAGEGGSKASKTAGSSASAKS
ncbi:MAG: O-antigen ligase family protein [Myxococcota bacterium]|nr:O-antigen ligase family protein [Myxococcota bacterium]